MSGQVDKKPLDIVQAQLEAYNAHDLEAFIATYSPDVEIFQLPDQKILEGHEAMRERYKQRFANPKLHAEIVNRMELGRFVIDYENVLGILENGRTQTIAIYEVEAGLIRRVWFAK